VTQIIVSGLLVGTAYALVGISLTLIFGVMHVVNFAHGDFVMVGLYIAFFAVGTLGLSVYASALLVIPALFVLGLITYWVAVHRTLKGPPIAQLLATFGVSLILVNGVQAAFSPEVRVIEPSGIAARTYHVGGIAIPGAQIVTAVVALACVAGLQIFLHRTAPGRLIRAASQDREAAALCGVNIDRVFAGTFALGIAGAGIAAVLLAPTFYARPDVGVLLTLVAFCVVVLGGMGSIYGALLAGLIVGVSEAVGGYWLPGSSARILMYSVFVGFLILRPQGLFGERHV
jgi:branched-chain amino acid transport system permease protein